MVLKFSQLLMMCFSKCADNSAEPGGEPPFPDSNDLLLA